MLSLWKPDESVNFWRVMPKGAVVRQEALSLIDGLSKVNCNQSLNPAVIQDENSRQRGKGVDGEG